MPVLGIDGVAIAEAHPGMDPFGDKSVHVLIQPGEIILSLLLLGLGPSALKAGIADAGLSYKTAELIENRIVPVHCFHSDRPYGLSVETGCDWMDFPDDGESGRMGLNILPGYGFHQLLRVQGQRKRKKEQKGKCLIHCNGSDKGYILPNGRHQRFQDRAYRSSPGSRPGNSRRRSGRS